MQYLKTNLSKLIWWMRSQRTNVAEMRIMGRGNSADLIRRLSPVHEINSIRLLLKISNALSTPYILVPSFVWRITSEADLQTKIKILWAEESARIVFWAWMIRWNYCLYDVLEIRRVTGAIAWTATPDDWGPPRWPCLISLDRDSHRPCGKVTGAALWRIKSIAHFVSHGGFNSLRNNLFVTCNFSPAISRTLRILWPRT